MRDVLTAERATTLQAFRDLFSDQVLRPGDEGYDALPPEVPRAKTDADGVCEFEDVSGSVVVAVQKSGYPMAFADVDVADTGGANAALTPT